MKSKGKRILIKNKIKKLELDRITKLKYQQVKSQFQINKETLRLKLIQFPLFPTFKAFKNL